MVLLALIVALLVIVAVHEAGHAGAAKALRFDDVRVRWLPPRTTYSGADRCLRVAAVSLAGPAANAVVAIPAWMVAATSAAGELSRWFGLGAFLSVLFGASNLVPVPGSDGWMAMAALGRALSHRSRRSSGSRT